MHYTLSVISLMVSMASVVFLQKSSSSVVFVFLTAVDINTHIEGIVSLKPFQVSHYLI